MLWWFVILGVSTAVIVSVAILLYIRVRQHMNRPTDHVAERVSNEEHTSQET